MSSKNQKNLSQQIAAPESHLRVIAYDDIKTVEVILGSMFDTTDPEVLKSLLKGKISKASPNVLLNFKDCQLVTSMAIGYLTQLSRELQELNGKLVFTNVSGDVLHVFKLLKFHNLFEFTRNRKEAVAYITKAE
jgi:anti-anti-sigma regulatory factor